MNLKKIELFGFKSFADKTELNFESGVTAIVGPNGVGKSNIAEAIRWVLGEQSARELRGLKMEDIIFNGTEKRLPLNFSEVALTFNNKDKMLPIEYDEVTISRRVFRTGESQYLLNKTTVRLKDITDLLAGTGVGIDSYSIIGQGKIDLILSSKPEDRRYIFEEAAGITKYKSRKKEALRKLEHTSDNLLRVNDIIKEVSRQLASIERQVKKANAYKKKFEELKNKEIKIAYCDIEKFKTELNSYLKRQHKLKGSEELLMEEINKMQALLQEAKEKLSDTEEKLGKLYSKKVDINAQIENANQRLFFNGEHINEIISRRESLEKQVGSASEKIKELEEQISKVQRELNVLKEAKEIKNQDIIQKEEFLKRINFQIRKSEEEIKQSKERIFEVTTSESKNKNELVKISAELSNVAARLKRLKIDKEETTQIKEKIEEKFFNFNLEKEEKNKKLSFLKEEKQKLADSLNSKNRGLEELKERLNELNQDFIAERSKLEYLKDLQAKFEGYQRGVKSIFKARENGRLPREEIIGSVANLIEVEPGYEKAVEAVLGNRAQIVVVRDYETLKKCIDYLKNEIKADATFICLEDMTVNEIENFGRLEFKPLTKEINCADEFRKVINFLFRNTCLVEDLETALIRKSQINEGNLKLVTKNGDIIERNMLTCRAHQSDENSLIGRDTKIKNLEESINTFKEKSSALKFTKAETEAELEKLRQELQKFESSLQKEEINFSNLSLSLQSIEAEKNRLDEEISLLNSEIEELVQEEITLNKNREELEEAIEEINKNSFEMKTVMTTSEDFIKEKKEEREKLLVAIAQLKAEKNSLVELENNQKQTFKMLEDNKEEQLSLFSVRKQEIENSAIRLEKLELDNEKIKKDTEVLNEEEKLAVNEFNAANILKEGQVKNIKEVEDFIKKKQENLEEAKNNLRNFQVKMTELSYQIQNLKQRILDSYKTNIEEIQVELSEDFDYEKTREEAGVLKQKLTIVTNVNLIAIEENQELQERFDFLNKQRQDLEEAKDSLHKAITKINKTTKTLFMETFAKIQDTFKEFYRLLFDGGEAKLELQDERDVLESGIEIAVRPPGKKLQNISLLSGGEKALTAVALLFAVFKVKPSPFCILDEIDAPLDESNVDRFTTVLKDFLKTSQFIIITHNKKTISMADVMYGVTMQEAGISKIVSVKFKESQEIEAGEVFEEALTDKV